MSHQFEVGSIIAYRSWRYLLEPARLMSHVVEHIWEPDFLESSAPSRTDTTGIHAFKTLDWATNYRNCNHHPTCCSNRTPGDGTVLGLVKLWGVVWEHNTGYRAQFARPIEFIDAVGREAHRAIRDLRQRWKLEN